MFEQINKEKKNVNHEFYDRKIKLIKNGNIIKSQFIKTHIVLWLTALICIIATKIYHKKVGNCTKSLKQI